MKHPQPVQQINHTNPAFPTHNLNYSNNNVNNTDNNNTNFDYYQTSSITKNNHVTPINSLNNTNDEEDLQRFERASKQQQLQHVLLDQHFDPETLAAMHQHHHHHHFMQQQQNSRDELFSKTKQIHEAAVHSKPLNYNGIFITKKAPRYIEWIFLGETSGPRIGRGVIKA